MDFPSIEFLRFDTRAMTALPDESTENVHRWLTSEEDLVLLNLCRVAPDVPRVSTTWMLCAQAIVVR